jgi:hypothetical protein
VLMPWIPSVMTVTRRINATTATRELGVTEAVPANVREAPSPLPAPPPSGALSAAGGPPTDISISMRDVRKTALTASSQLPLTKPVVPAARQRTTADAVGSAASNRVNTYMPLQEPSTAQQPLPLPGYRGSLAVSSSPSGARVFVNGVPAGATPLLLHDIPAGSRVVRIELDGHERWSAAARIVANEETRVTATLRPASNRQ